MQTAHHILIGEIIKDFAFLYAITSIVKIIMLFMLFGKPVRNIKYAIQALLSNLISTLLFIVIMQAIWLTQIAIPIYMTSIYAYLIAVALTYIAASFVVEFFTNYYLFLRDRIARSDLASALLMASLFAYFIAFQFGAILPFAGI